jgi:hypothetical protein
VSADRIEDLRRLEVELLEVPEIRAEVMKYAPTLRRLNETSFVALSIAMRRESARRLAPPPRPVGIGNR